MPLSMPESLREVMRLPMHTWAVCWTIVRTDGVRLNFTDHSAELVIETEENAPEAFSPEIVGVQSSARQEKHGLSENNLEALGVVTSEAITEADLWAGLYLGAEVIERIVDWRRPWMGPWKTSRYTIGQPSFTGTRWEAEISGVTSLLRRRVGNKRGRSCASDLGDSICGVDLASFTVFDVRVASVTDRGNFDAFDTDISGALVDDYFRDGFIYWQTGANAGVESPIRSYTTAGRVFALHLETPFAIAVDDRFQVVPGCNKTTGDCKDKYSNRENFNAYETMPGTDELLGTSPGPNA